MPPKKTKVGAMATSKSITAFFRKVDTPQKRVLNHVGVSSDEEERNEKLFQPAKRRPVLDSENDENNPISLSPSFEEKRTAAEAKLWSKKLNATTLGQSWMKVLVPEFKKQYFQELMEFVSSERSRCTVYPPAHEVFSWTTACPLEDVKVVILGQDPYHNPNQAHGLCFSVRVGVTPPPSLRNIYKELENSISDFKIPDHGYLMGWAKQGVLLLNACLTVRQKEPNSHSGKGWETFTDAVIHWLNNNHNGIVFIFWGAYAQRKGAFIDQRKHHVLKAAHPSPFSAHKGFLGCGHFIKTNQFLAKSGKKCIDWGCLPKQ